MIRWILGIVFLASLTACGLKGALYLPQDPNAAQVPTSAGSLASPQIQNSHD